MELLMLCPGAGAVLGRPALLLHGPRGRRALVVADLHIGWESTLADKGFHIPAQVGKMHRALEELLRALRPDVLVFLGDVKHTVSGVEAEEWAQIPAFFEALSGLVGRLVVVPGNHDGRIEALLPDGVELAGSGGLVLWGFGLFHGHAWPDPDVLACETLVTGHMHPVVSFREGPFFRTTARVWLVAPCDGDCLAEELARRGRGRPEEPSARRLIVMPSFNEFLGGQAVNAGRRRAGDEKLIGPVLRTACVPMADAEVYMLDGTFLGTIRHLRQTGL